MITRHLISTNNQKLLRFFLLHPGKTFFEREISRKTRISPSSANHALNRLHKAGLLKRKRNGKMCFYSIDKTNPYLREFKVLSNMLLIEPLIEKFKKHSRKIVLFGSWADGSDTDNSDIYLFIVSSEKEKVLSTIAKFSNSHKLGKRKITAIIREPEWHPRKQDRVLRGKLRNGKILWDSDKESSKKR